MERNASERHVCSKTCCSAVRWYVGEGEEEEGGIRRAQKHGNRWSARWMGGAGMCASVCVFVCVCVSSALQQTLTKKALGQAISCSSCIKCMTLGLISDLACMVLPLNTAGGLPVLLSL